MYTLFYVLFHFFGHVRECDKLHAILLYCFNLFMFFFCHYNGITKAVFTEVRVDKEVFFFVFRFNRCKLLSFSFRECCRFCLSVIGFQECEDICFETHQSFFSVECVGMFELLKTTSSTFFVLLWTILICGVPSLWLCFF